MSTETPPKEPLLEKFDAPDMAVWRSLVETQLKGAPFEKKMMTKTPEGIILQPIYAKKDASALPASESLPGQFPYLRSTKSSGYKEKPWDVCQDLLIADPKEFNKAMLEDLNCGQRAVSLTLQDDYADAGGTNIRSLDDFQKAIQGLDTSSAPLHLKAGRGSLALASYFLTAVNDENVTGSLGIDVFGPGIRSGELPPDAIYDDIAAVVKEASVKLPNVRVLSIDLTTLGNSGADAVQELSVMLAAGSAYMRALLARDIDPSTAANTIRVIMGIGSDYFKEICKFRAARTLWAFMLKGFGVPEEEAVLQIHAQSLDWNKTIHDPYVNMLRTTTEGFSAVLGGCDSMSLGAFDRLNGEPDTFSRRISRNQQTILAEEAHLCETIDPAGGSWYLETLTRQLSESAWSSFQEIEKEGGLVNALVAGTIQDAVAQRAASRKLDLSLRKAVMVGTNMYANLDEKPLPDRKSLLQQEEKVSSGDEKIQALLANIKERESLVQSLKQAAISGASLCEVTDALFSDLAMTPIKGLRPARLTSEYEELRSFTSRYRERGNEKPKILLANMGGVKQHKVRADFTAEFLKPLGYEIISDMAFETVDDAVAAVESTGAVVTVMCSTDDTYPELVPDFAKKVKAKNSSVQILIAGFIKESEAAFREAGVNEFLHVRSNNLELLTQLQKNTGVRS